MREIKFRAWNPTKKTMGKPWDFVRDMKTAPGPENCYDKFPDSTIFMQYTGLHDKNSREIYEGDVLKSLKLGTGWPLEIVEWQAPMFYVKWPDGREGYLNQKHIDEEGMEVIGNIYENPELLEPTNVKEKK